MGSFHSDPQRVVDPLRVKKITEAVLSLPVLPTITAKILEMVDNPKTSALSLANLLSKDQVLTARILKIANSSFYSLSREINTVKQAVVVMGYESLREMSLSLAIFNIFKSEKASPYFNISEFWKHSIAVGLGAQYIANDLSYKDSGVAFTAGLLHDLGKMVLHHYLPREFNEVQDLVHDRGIELKEAENLVWGVGHSEVGAWLAKRWKLPNVIEDVIAHHHSPWDSETDPMLCKIVYLTDYLVTSAKIGYRGSNSTGVIPEEEWESLKVSLAINEEHLELWKAAIFEEYQVKASDLISEAVRS